MTHKERIDAAFAMRPTDRVPVFDQTVFSNVGSAATGRDLDIGGGELRFREACSWIAGETAHAEFVEKMLQDVAWFYRQVGYDMIRMPWRETRRPSQRIDESTFLFGSRDDAWAVCTYSPETGNWHETDNYLRHDGVDRLISDIRSQVEAYDGPESLPDQAFAEWDRLLHLAGPDLAAACGAGGIGFGMHEPAWLEALYLEPELMLQWHDQHADRQIAAIEAFHRHGATVCLAGGDFCYNAGPAYSPDLFRRIVLPGLRRIVLACERLGMRYVFRTDLTPEQVRAYRISDNKTGELADWDLDILPIELSELKGAGVDLHVLGFDDEELAKLLVADLQQGMTDPDAIPEPPDDAITQRGDIWVLGNHRLMCGDSASPADLDRLLDGATIDLFASDPPYNVRVEPRSNNAIAAGLSSFS